MRKNTKSCNEVENIDMCKIYKLCQVVNYSNNALNTENEAPKNSAEHIFCIVMTTKNMISKMKKIHEDKCNEDQRTEQTSFVSDFKYAVLKNVLLPWKARAS